MSDVKVLISIDPKGDSPNKQVRLYNMNGQAIGFGDDLINQGKDNDMFSNSVTKPVVFTVSIDLEKLSAPAGSDWKPMSMEEWRTKYLANGFVVPAVEGKEWDELVEYWCKNKGTFVNVPKILSKSTDLPIEPTEIVERKDSRPPVIEEAEIVPAPDDYEPASYADIRGGEMIPVNIPCTSPEPKVEPKPAPAPRPKFTKEDMDDLFGGLI